jgi:hypothetical protein
MDDENLADLLVRAGVEISNLRRRNEVLEAVNRTVEIFGTALFTQGPSRGESIDIGWELQRAADALGRHEASVTEEVVAPLDAYATAKPDEPTWTAQGGDPLAAPLLRVWAAFARLQSGIVTPGLLDGIFSQLRNAAIKNPPKERERDSLLIRATQTEQVSWQMDEYRKGGHTVQREEKADSHIDEMARIDLHKARLLASEKVSYMRGDLEEILVELVPSWLAAGGGPEIEAMIPELRDVIDRLRDVYQEIEPRRLFRKDEP